MQNENNVIIGKLLLQESDRYQPQYRRSFETHLTGEIHDLIINRFRNIKGQPTTGALASGVAEVFMQPAMQGKLVSMPQMPGQQISAENTWRQIVYRAMLEVEVRSETGHSVSFVMTAFSDPIDPSMLGAINPRLPFYIGTITVLRKYIDRTSGVSEPVIGLGSASQLIADNKFAGFNKGYDYRVRPMDVFSYIGQEAMDLGSPQTDIYDERTVLTETPIKSEARNTLPGVFVSKVLGAYAAAQDSSGEIGGTGFDKLAEAQGQVQEQEAAQDLFLRALRNIRGVGYNDSIRNFFTIEELQRLSPNEITMRPRLVPLTKEVVRMRSGGPGEDWGHAKPLQRMASFIRDTIPALMMENMLMRAHIKMTNRAFVDGRPSATLIDWGSFSGADIGQNIVQLENRIIREVFMPLSEQNTLTLEVEMLMFVDSDSRISIQFESYPVTEFVAPTFAAPLFTPVVTSNAQAAFTMASDFKSLGDMISDATTQLPTMRGAVFQGGKKAF